MCFFETYLVEFVNKWCGSKRVGEIFLKNGEERREGVIAKFNRILKRLEETRLLDSAGRNCVCIRDDSRSYRRLVHWRNGLVHGLASYPQRRGYESKADPSPKPEELNKLQRGWAIATALEPIERLHDASSKRRPNWMSIPETWRAK